MPAGAPVLGEIAQVAEQSCLELLEHYGVLVDAPHSAVVGLLGYRGSVRLLGPEVTGVCTVTADDSALRAALSLPLAGSALLDWAGEIANQLAGRLKHRLGRRGLRTALALPVTTVDDLAQLVASDRGGAGAQVEVACRRGGIAIEINLDLASGQEQVEFATPPQDAAGPGIEFVAFDLEFCTTLAPKRAG